MIGDGSGTQALASAYMIEEPLQLPDRAQRRALLGVLARAFRDNPMNVEIHGPNLRRRIQANRAGLRSIVLDSAELIDSRVIALDGRLVGGFLLAPPELPVLPTPHFLRQVGCFFQQGARAMDRWGAVTQRLGQERPLYPHWYLAVLGIEPAEQGKGLGGRLLDSIFETVNARPAPLYLECDQPSSVEFYLQRGFEVRSEQAVNGVQTWCLGAGFADESLDLCDSVRQA